MAALMFVDKWPTVNPSHGQFQLAATSGDETINLLLTRHALLGLIVASKKASDTVFEEERRAQLLPFSAKRKNKEKA